MHSAVTSRSGLSIDTKVNLIIGVFTIITGVLSTQLAWAMWKLTRGSRRRRGHQSQFPYFNRLETILDRAASAILTRPGPTIEEAPLALVSEPRARLGYEFALRFGRNL